MWGDRVHQIYCITGQKQYNITPIVGQISWRSNIDELGVQLDFDVAFNDIRLFPKSPVDIGSMVVLKNTDEIFRGFVVTEQKQGRNPIQYNAFDGAFYLNKSKEVYQFSKIAADTAIKKILSDFGVPIGSIASMSLPISKIYPGETGADIIKDILEQVQQATGIKYRMEMRGGKLYIEKQQDLLIKAAFKLADNIGAVDVTEAISEPHRKRSIEEMRNSIKIISDNKVLAEVKNDALIKQYGLLQDVQSIDQKDLAKAKQVASNLLKDLGKIFEENSINVLGDDRVRAGRIIEVTEQITGMSGKYLIKDVTHTINNGLHTMQLGLGVV